MHRFLNPWSLVAGGLILLLTAVSAAERRVPPPGIPMPVADREELRTEARELGLDIEIMRLRWKESAEVDPKTLTANQRLALLPDVQVFQKAVAWAVDNNEFYRTNQLDQAWALLREGRRRIQALREGKAPWTSATGLVVRGYVSALDDSVQPYGLVIPNLASSPPRGHRLDVWLHGRDNHLTELKFITGRMKSAGQFTPSKTVVLHPYGRFCNAFKFAGEIDVLEAMAHVQRQYRINPNRISIRGFSMGGAGAWHLAVHHPTRWAAAAPGAGFAETAEYSGILNKQPDLPGYERHLWHWYDATDYAVNLFNLPLIAYSGEKDKQIQAARVMAKALHQEGLLLSHLIGPGTGHKYEPNTKRELIKQFDERMASGKNPVPKKIRFTTWTLRYPQSHWVQIDALDQHWRRARVDASIENDEAIHVTTENVAALTLSMNPSPFPSDQRVMVRIDGRTLKVKPGKQPAGRWQVALRKKGTRWRIGHPEASQRKRPGLQGPIDDAFMNRFLMVRPTGPSLNDALEHWVQSEFSYASNQWRSQFRGDVRIKNDTHVTAEDIADSNLILWGDPNSNGILKQIVDKLPLHWTDKTLRLKDTRVSGKTHVPLLIFPNPLNPDRYVVLNSGFTFSAFGHLSNSLQTPKLPDWALVDTRVSRGDRQEKGVHAAGFFDENWE